MIFAMERKSFNINEEHNTPKTQTKQHVKTKGKDHVCGKSYGVERGLVSQKAALFSISSQRLVLAFLILKECFHLGSYLFRD